MEVSVDLRQVFGDKGPIHRDRVAGQRGLARAWGIFIEVLKNCCARLFVSNAVRDLCDQPRGGVHLAHKVVHAIDRLLAGLDHQVHAFAQDIELGVGHQDRDLDQDIFFELKARHLAINPDQVRRFISHGPTLGESALAAG